MPRKPKYPPVPHPHPSRQCPIRSRVRWDGVEYYLPPIGSPEHQTEYVALLARLAAADSQRTGADSLENGSGQAKRTESGQGVDSWPTIRVAAAQYLLYAQQHYANHAEFRQYRLALELLTQSYGDLPTDRFGVAELDELRQEGCRRGWCKRTCNVRATRIKTIWRWLERKKLAPKGSWGHLLTLEHLGPQDHEYHEYDPVEPAGWTAVVAISRRLSPHWRCVWLLQWFTGTRPSELLRMKPGELDRTGEEWLFCPTRHKGSWRGHGKVVVVGPRAQKVLAPWLVDVGEDEHVFPGRKPGESLTYRAYANAIEAAREAVGVQIHAYQLRHAAKDRVDREFGERVAQSVLGHRNIETTRQYARNAARREDVERAREAARRLG